MCRLDANVRSVYWSESGQHVAVVSNPCRFAQPGRSLLLGKPYRAYKQMTSS